MGQGGSTTGNHSGGRATCLQYRTATRGQIGSRAVKLREILKGFRFGRKLFFGLPFGGIKIRLAVVKHRRYPSGGGGSTDCRTSEKKLAGLHAEKVVKGGFWGELARVEVCQQVFGECLGAIFAAAAAIPMISK